MPRRAIVYIDGFNLYHALSDLGIPALKWLNLWALSQSLLRKDEQLMAVKYFSAFATWLPGPYSRHRQYVKALECVGVRPIMGRFKEKPRHCASCGARWVSHEEKETDVNIAIHLIQDVFTNQFDRAIVISADSDLVPAIELGRRHDQTKRIVVMAPPGRFAYARDLHPILEITKGRVRRYLFEAEVSDPNGPITVRRPSEYDP
jgi:NYN domain